MSIQLTCESGKNYRLKNTYSGKRVKCAACGHVIQVPRIKAEYDVFVSYSIKDKAAADALCFSVESEGLRCWIAPRDIAPGATWAESIVSAVDKSKILLLVFSAHANRSPHVLREVERAVKSGIAILPVQIEKITPSPALDYFIATQHWMDATSPPLRKHLSQLARFARTLIEQYPGNSPRVQMQESDVEQKQSAEPARNTENVQHTKPITAATADGPVVDREIEKAAATVGFWFGTYACEKQMQKKEPPDATLTICSEAIQLLKIPAETIKKLRSENNEISRMLLVMNIIPSQILASHGNSAQQYAILGFWCAHCSGILLAAIALLKNNTAVSVEILKAMQNSAANSLQKARFLSDLGLAPEVAVQLLERINDELHKEPIYGQLKQVWLDLMACVVQIGIHCEDPCNIGSVKGL